MHPTRGLDIAATEAVRSALIRHRDQGVAVLLISEDLDEVLSVSDRVVVMFEGKIKGSFKTAETSRDEIGLMMGGSAQHNI
jgi:simple sugar transport system ATP-binding protein